MSLASSSVVPVSPLKPSERRVFPRRPARGQANVVRLSAPQKKDDDSTIQLDVRDISAGGMSGYTNTPIRKGERVTLFFDAAVTQKPFAADGQVVRCDASHFGYCVAVAFERTPKV